ncbi:hypothetical protein EBBID32_43840 [Sphingobium indicum BiD32]|uniref:Uncharacterized protein n=1 Tax=Sphingobium indicum BiD32 TaxID=1301087 RepID=N1MXK7_9SPHN|nr:hypothetical protein EBBID32_43840 [Sphingobium indicum BiD32]
MISQSHAKRMIEKWSHSGFRKFRNKTMLGSAAMLGFLLDRRISSVNRDTTTDLERSW